MIARLLFVVIAVVVASSGCVSNRTVIVPTYTAAKAVADSNGWYHFSTYWYRGPLLNDVPDGRGECKTQYAITGKSNVEWIDAPCEFRAGLRIDEQHQLRAERSLDHFREDRAYQLRSEAEDQRSRNAYAAQQREENELARREANASMSGAIRDLQGKAAANSAMLASIDRQTAQAVNQAQQQMNRAQQQRLDAAEERQREAANSARQAQQQRQATAQTSANETAQNQRAEQAKKDSQERAHKEAAAKAQVEQQRREQVAKEEQQRQQRAREKEAREAKERADALAAKNAEEAARRNYLTTMIQGVRLRATKCPDGEGKYYATGSRPRIKPEVVSCIDVHYRASCPGSTQYSEGIAHNFIGMSGCFGDTYDIHPKPNCKIEQVRIEVVDAKGCP